MSSSLIWVVKEAKSLRNLVSFLYAAVAEQADAQDLKSCGVKSVRVRFPSAAAKAETGFMALTMEPVLLSEVVRETVLLAALFTVCPGKLSCSPVRRDGIHRGRSDLAGS